MRLLQADYNQSISNNIKYINAVSIAIKLQWYTCKLDYDLYFEDHNLINTFYNISLRILKQLLLTTPIGYLV